VKGEGGQGSRAVLGRAATWAVLFILHLSPFLVPALAQVPEDSTYADSVAAEDTVNQTARFLEAQQQIRRRVPVMPDLAPPGPRPSLTRIVFNRDSIEWGHAATVGDLLSQVPGVYLWRGGFIGRPEDVNFEGRGASSVEYYLDGLPYVPAGVDSLSVDPALFSISFLDRIEVDRWPGALRVYLFTRRHDRRAPRSRIAIARGDGNYARYEASLERRYDTGFGFAAAADYLSSPTASGTSSSYSNTQVWIQGSYVPKPTFGLQYQLVRSGPNRRPFVVSDPVPNDTIGARVDATRTDAQFRLALRKRETGVGPYLDLLYGRTGWNGDSVDQQVNQLGGYVGIRGPTAQVGASAFYRSRWTALDARASAGVTPVAGLTASAEAVLQHHRGGRSNQYVTLAAGVQPVHGLSLTGSARIGSVVAAPAILTDTAQDVRDYQAMVAWDGSRIGLQGGWTRTSAFSPFGYAEYLTIPSIGPVPETEWLTVGARVAPVRWVTLEGWYSDPRNGIPEGLPPTHSLTAVTLRSKFLRQFPSGVFDLKLRFSMEAWGDGVIGRDVAGDPVELKGATFFRSLLQIQLQSFSLFWDRWNLSATKLTYVPGFRIPAYGSTFGVRWEFLN
jgi:hypothetical protein